MLFVERPHTAQEIRNFCGRFNEGFRVEYKQEFDNNVRRNLPKIVSSFANSLGGVLVVGVRTDRGTPRPPIEGFEPPPREELALTVENICLQSIHPPVLPRSTVVPGDVQDRAFLVVEIDESWEAPHAIENSKKVYVRTGDASNPHELADVNLVIELVRRREGPLRLHQSLLAQARSHASIHVADGTCYAEISIGPAHPRRALCTLDQTWEFLYQNRYRGGRFYPADTLRRVENGAAAFHRNEYGEVTKYGLVFGRKRIGTHTYEGAHPPVEYLVFADLFQLVLKNLVCAARFCESVGYRGNLLIEISIHNALRQKMPFLPQPEFFELDGFICFDNMVKSEQVVASERISERRGELLCELLGQVCWSFWQSLDRFPTEYLRQYVTQRLGQMGAL